MPQSSCFPIPQEMTYDEAALSEPLAIGMYAVKQSIPMFDATVGILGFGPIGMSVMLSALAKGASKVYVTDKIDDRVSMARSQQADWAGNPLKENIVAGILDWEPKGLDVVFECCGQQEAMDQAVELVKPGAKIMIAGIPETDRWTFSVDRLRHKEITIGNVRRQNHTLEETLEIIASGILDISTMVTHRFPLEHSREAFDLVAGYHDGVMKTMIDI
jgi:L-iditol 2-dehydrogenase